MQMTASGRCKPGPIRDGAETLPVDGLLGWKSAVVIDCPRSSATCRCGRGTCICAALAAVQDNNLAWPSLGHVLGGVSDLHCSHSLPLLPRNDQLVVFGQDPFEECLLLLTVTVLSQINRMINCKCR